ncbi:endolytic transglycosylase MltG [Boudabousia tangfeifanii]|uniref:endolytic transglycosylase MltG n=1 Tax=Boudabousia tangfeifanii TaxID=1912795 RepID=UPI0009F2BC7A|nr:endolytic transglycosylase MltG [Boudabousia tangfeifanii]
MTSPDNLEPGKRAIPSRRQMRHHQGQPSSNAPTPKVEGGNVLGPLRHEAPSTGESTPTTQTTPTPASANPPSLAEAKPQSTNSTSAASSEQSSKTTAQPARPFAPAVAQPSHKDTVKAKGPKRSKQWIATLLVIATIVLLAFLGIYLVKSHLVKSPAPVAEDYTGKGETAVTVEVPEGASGAQIAQALKDKDVVASTKAFIKTVSQNSEGNLIQPGTYELKTKMSSAAALAALLDRSNRVDVGITIPEGFTVKRITQRLVKRGGYKQEEVEAAFKNPEAIGLPPQANGNPEGWIAPGTYLQKPGEKVTDFIRNMVVNNVERLKELGIPADQQEAVLTKASILEREVSIEKYMPQVARVIDNRLDPVKGKEVLNRLQMDSTVSYAVGRSGGIPTAEELKVDSPYNTYIKPGLPPSPIGVAGTAAIKAVLKPAEGDWLYFVTTNLKTGETVFVDTYEQFNQEKEKLKAFCQENPEICHKNS